MRPSAQQLLQHERIDYAAKVDETEKLYVRFFLLPLGPLFNERHLPLGSQM